VQAYASCNGPESPMRLLTEGAHGSRSGAPGPSGLSAACAIAISSRSRQPAMRCIVADGHRYRPFTTSPQTAPRIDSRAPDTSELARDIVWCSSREVKYTSREV